KKRSLERTIAVIMRRHESLRTTFHTADGDPLQAIAPAAASELPVMDPEKLPHPERENEVQRLALEQAREPFDLTRDLMIRATLTRLEEEQHVLLVTAHRVAADHESMN